MPPKAITLSTAKQAYPMIYAYSTPQIAAHKGWLKIGYTENNDVETRIRQQTHTSDTEAKLEWQGSAIFDDGTYERFTDKDFHSYLRRRGVENKKGTEWFHIDPLESQLMFYAYRTGRGFLKIPETIPYQLRKEQQEAVKQTAEYYRTHENGSFLWNAKPRFGKTLSVYDFCKTIQAQTVLIATNRPAIANSWYSDYEQFMGDESGYKFVSETPSLRTQPYVMTRSEYLRYISQMREPANCIEFLSLQDLKGSIYFGGKIDKLKEVKDMNWDVLVIDEAHEGVDTLKTDTAFDHIKRRFTLHLSGTPFKALASDKFPESAIYNWTYADEQKAKRDWNSTEDNPYANLPNLNLFTYQMSEIVRDELSQGIEIDGEASDYAFDLNEFFETKNGRFVHDSSVSKFLDAMTLQEKFPFSTPKLRAELKHTFWLLNRVDSAKALAKKLEEHPVFSKYKVVLAAGDGKLDDSEETQKAYDRVREAIRDHEYTITLSVGQLTTGITIKEWSAVLMLSNVKSPALYMQAAFRAQNPCLFKSGDGKFYRKQNAYVFDFDPARTLNIFEQFANDLSADTAGGNGDMDSRKQHIRELLNFFPVIGEDENGEMIELDAEKVLSIPRKLRSQEVVRRGFMSNYLFQNVNGIFSAPQEVIQIINQFTPIEEPKAKNIPVTPETQQDLHLNPETGEVEIPQEQIIGTATEVFGEKVYAPVQDGVIEEQIQDAFKQAESKTETKSAFDDLKKQFKETTVRGIIDIAKEKYAENLKPRDAKELEKQLNGRLERTAEKVFGNYQIEENIAENSRLEELQKRHETGRTEAEIQQEFEAKKQELKSGLKEQLSAAVETFIQESTVDVVETIEKKTVERQKKSIEDSIRDHLRGFSRTIPSFLMAYGDESVTLENFDTIIPDEVFMEVTSISLKDFRFLRDGGEYTDENGETKYFGGHLFDPVVFDDSVREFLRLKKKLSNYFDESSTEDIFDYIPPQKTNQIFTPKKTVKQMVDLLEQENPGCFDDPNKTFIDLYMKSGLYIAELVKRLYQSEGMKIAFPNQTNRLHHIFKHQVYGLAPTEIIYRIALAFILGFDETVSVEQHNLRLFDALPYAKDGTLTEQLDGLFG